MKLLFLSAVFLSFSASAMLKKASIDGALSHRYDENYEETSRSFAGQIEPEEAKASESKDKSKDKGDRNPSSQGQAFDQANESGIRYWKY